MFGLDKAKSWVLLAEYLDPSALHNYTAFNLASELSGLAFTPIAHKVNVYLNGTYIGLYTLCEQVQENEGRMDIEMDEITEDMTDLKDFNFFICVDQNAKDDPTAVLDETYYYIPEYDRYFELKYPEKEDFVSDEQFASFLTQLKTYTKEMMDAFANGDTETIDREVNLDSLIDYASVDQIMGEQDHTWKSFNMYYVANSSNPNLHQKLSFGPIWDYDWSLYTPWTGTPNESYDISDEITYSNVFFTALATEPAYYERLKERYSSLASEVLENYINGFDNLTASMEESVCENDKLWYSELDKDISSKNIAFLKDYLKKRKEVLDEAWSTT